MVPHTNLAGEERNRHPIDPCSVENRIDWNCPMCVSGRKIVTGNFPAQFLHAEIVSGESRRQITSIYILIEVAYQDNFVTSMFPLPEKRYEV